MKVGDRAFANAKMKLDGGKVAIPGDYIGNVVYADNYEVLVEIKNEKFSGWTPDSYDIDKYKILYGRQYWWFHLNNLIYKNNLLMETE